MDYPTAAFLAVIALTGLVSIIIYRVPLRKTAKNDTHPQHNNDTKLLTQLLARNDRQIELLVALLAATKELSSLPVTTQVAHVAVPMSLGTGTKPTKIILDAVEWLNSNPDHANKTVRQIAALSGFSKSTIDRAKKVKVEQK